MAYDLLGLIVYAICLILSLVYQEHIFFYFILFINPILTIKVSYLFAILEIKLILDYFFIHESNITALLFFTKLCFVYRISTYYEISEIFEMIEMIKKRNIKHEDEDIEKGKYLSEEKNF